MGRKKVEINPECGKRLSQLLAKYKMQQKDLADALNYTPQQISRIVTGKERLTEDFAHKVVDFFRTGDLEHDLFELVDYRWLLCGTDFESEGERMDAFFKEKSEINRLVLRLIQLHGYDIVTKEFPVDTDRLTQEEYKKYTEKPYNTVKYAIESYRLDRDMIFKILDHSEIDKIFTDIDNFVEFTCSKYLKRPFNNYLQLRKEGENG